VSIPASRWDDVLTWGASFDGSSIRGFARIEESDMSLYTDLSTFVILPVESSVAEKNGYYATLLLTAGLEGIKKKYDLPPAMEENVYHFTSEERKEEGIESLPGSLIEAIMEAEKGTIARKVLGDSAFEKLIASKKAQWDEYRTKVTRYEIEKYFPVL